MTAARVLCLSIPIVALVLGSRSEAIAQSTSDSKLWAGFTGKAELTPKLRATAEQQARAGSETGFEKTFTQIALRFRAAAPIRLAAHYRFIITDGRGVWHRVGADIQLSHRLGKVGLAYRLRWQTTSRDDGSRTTVRNRARAIYRLSRRVEPFVAAELHYLTTNSEFREARGYVGFDYAINRKNSVNAFYLYQNEFNKMVGESNHILAIGIEHRFRRAPKRRRK